MDLIIYVLEHPALVEIVFFSLLGFAFWRWGRPVIKDIESRGAKEALRDQKVDGLESRMDKHDVMCDKRTEKIFDKLDELSVAAAKNTALLEKKND